MAEQVTEADTLAAREWRRREAEVEPYEGQEERLAALLARTRADAVADLRAAVYFGTTGDCTSADRVSTYRACLVCRRDLATCDRDFRLAPPPLACRGATARAMLPPGYTVDNSPETIARIRERFGNGLDV